MTPFAIIFWSLIGVLIIAYIVYESRQRRKQRKIEQVEKQKKSKILDKITEYKTRYYKVRRVFSKIAGPKLFLDADELLDQIDDDYYRNFDYDYLQKVLKRAEKEIQIVEEEYNDHQNKILLLKQKNLEFTEIVEILQKKIVLCKSMNLTEKDKKILLSVQNRLSVDVMKVNQNPQRAINRSLSSMRKLDEILQ